MNSTSTTLLSKSRKLMAWRWMGCQCRSSLPHNIKIHCFFFFLKRKSPDLVKCNKLQAIKVWYLDFSVMWEERVNSISPLLYNDLWYVYIYLVVEGSQPLNRSYNLTQRDMVLHKIIGSWAFFTWILYKFFFPVWKSHSRKCITEKRSSKILLISEQLAPLSPFPSKLQWLNTCC